MSEHCIIKIYIPSKNSLQFVDIIEHLGPECLDLLPTIAVLSLLVTNRLGWLGVGMITFAFNLALVVGLSILLLQLEFAVIVVVNVLKSVFWIFLNGFIVLLWLDRNYVVLLFLLLINVSLINKLVQIPQWAASIAWQVWFCCIIIFITSANSPFRITLNFWLHVILFKLRRYSHLLFYVFTRRSIVWPWCRIGWNISHAKASSDIARSTI